jgi:hypothetical protein
MAQDGLVHKEMVAADSTWNKWSWKLLPAVYYFIQTPTDIRFLPGFQKGRDIEAS